MHSTLVTADIPEHHTGLEAVFMVGAPVVVPKLEAIVRMGDMSATTLDDAIALLGLAPEDEPQKVPPAILWFDGINP